MEVQTDLLQKLIQEHFGHYTNLKGYVRSGNLGDRLNLTYIYFCSELIFTERSRCRDGAKKMLEKILQMENDPFFTQNLEDLSMQEKKWYNSYLQEMNRETNGDAESETNGDTESESDSSPVSPTPPQPIGRGKEVPWRKEDEVSVMANVQAYFQVTHHARIS